MKHIKPSWLMCDALIDTLMYLHDDPQTIAQLIEHTDIPTSRASWHLSIFRDWHLVREHNDHYHLTDNGHRLTAELRRHLRAQNNASLSTGQLLALCSAQPHPTTPNAITRAARERYPDEFEALRALKRGLAELVDDGHLEVCHNEEKIRAQYRRTPSGYQALNDALTRWESIARHLPPAAGALHAAPQALRLALYHNPELALETA